MSVRARMITQYHGSTTREVTHLHFPSNVRSPGRVLVAGLLPLGMLTWMVMLVRKRHYIFSTGGFSFSIITTQLFIMIWICTLNSCIWLYDLCRCSGGFILWFITPLVRERWHGELRGTLDIWCSEWRAGLDIGRCWQVSVKHHFHFSFSMDLHHVTSLFSMTLDMIL